MRTLFAPLALLAVLSACASGDETSSPALDLSAEDTAQTACQLRGVVQKGPMLASGTLTARPLDLALNPGEQAGEVSLLDDLGTFELGLAAGGPMLLQARGLWFNELRGELAATPVTLGAAADLALGDNRLNLNALTQACLGRALELARGGLPLPVANLQALDELLGALGIFAAELHPTLPPTALDLSLPLPEDHALLAGFSAVLLEAARRRGGSMDGKVQELLGQVNSDFSDGTLEAALVEEFQQANETLDSRLFVKRLSTWFAEAPGGPGYLCADPDLVLDRDRDGLANAKDNCPDYPNPLQTDTDKDHLGDICDPCPATACAGHCLPADGAARPQDLCHLPCDAAVCPEAQTCLESQALCGPLGTCCVPDGEAGGACLEDQTCTAPLLCLPDDPSCPPPLNSCCG